MTSFLSTEELAALGLKHIGENVKISRNAKLYTPQLLSVGKNSRIDDFCILAGDISIGNHVHISPACIITAGDKKVTIEDYVALSSRSAIYAISDDFYGKGMANPTVPDAVRCVYGADVVLKKHVLVGTGSTILKGVTIEEGTSVGAMSLISKNLEAWSVYVGVPCRKVAERSKYLLELEKQMEELQ